MQLNYRTMYKALFLFSGLLLSGSILMEYVFGLIPCPLCWIARILVGFLMLNFAIALLHQRAGRCARGFYSLLAIIFAGLGMAVTMRHLWIIHLPADLAPSCTPGIDYLMDNLPFLEAIFVVLNGSGECANTNGAFMGIPLPGWTFAAFLLMMIGSMISLLQTIKKKGG